jgi:pantothenate synthetase
MFQLFDIVETKESYQGRRDVQCFNLIGRSVEDGTVVVRKQYDFLHEGFVAVDESFTQDQAEELRCRANMFFKT